MKRTVFLLIGLVLVALPAATASAWSHSGAYGSASGGGGSWNASGYRGGSASGGGGSWSGTGFRGSTASGSDGSWSGSGFRGGSASGGDGSWSGTGYRGGTASGGGGSWHATGADGGTASGGGGYWHGTTSYGTTVYGGAHYYGGTYSTYHPPTVVNSYYGSGCYNCGGWPSAGAAAVGGFIGARLAQMKAEQAAAATPPPPTYVMGGIYPGLPAGCMQSGSGSYYNCNGTWFSASFGANGVYYRVVPPPAGGANF